MESSIVGIDVGSSSSSLAVLETGTLSTVTVPSVLSYAEDGLVVGERAVDRMISSPARTVTGFNRRLGSNASVDLPGGSRSFAPVELTASLLRALLERARGTTARTIDRCVLTVPVSYTATQRRALRTAATIADLAVDRIVDDPTATAVGYCARHDIEGRILVYDLGGGSFDAALIDWTDGGYEVLATGGDGRIGSDAFDAAIVEWLELHLERRYNIAVWDDPTAVQQLFQAAEQAKHALGEHRSTAVATTIAHNDDDYDIDLLLHRPQFEQRVQPVLSRTIDVCESLLTVVGVPTASVDHLLVVGKTAALSFLPETVESAIGVPATVLTDEPISAIGGAYRGAWIRGSDRRPTDAAPGVGIDVTPHAVCLGPSPTHPEEWIPNNAVVPGRCSTVVTTQTNRQESIIVPVYYAFDPATTDTPPAIPAHRRMDGQATVQDQHRSTDGAGRQQSVTECHDSGTTCGLLDALQIGPLWPQPAGEPSITVTVTLTADGIVTANATRDADSNEAQIDAVSLFRHGDDRISRMTADRPSVRR